MSYNTLDYTVDDGVLTLTLNRPDHLNAFTVEMANELVDAFNRASADMPDFYPWWDSSKP